MRNHESIAKTFVIERTIVDPYPHLFPLSVAVVHAPSKTVALEIAQHHLGGEIKSEVSLEAADGNQYLIKELPGWT